MSSIFPAFYFSNPYRRPRVPQQQAHFSQHSASSGMLRPANGDAGVYTPMRSNQSSYTVPNMSGHHQAARSLQSTVGLRPDYQWVNRAQENIYLSGGRQDTVPSIVIAQSPAMPLSPSPATPPSAYTDVSDSSLPPQSPMEMSSPYPMHGPAGQSAAPSSSFPPGRPTALTRGPSFEAIRLNGSATLYCCRDCTYRTHRRSDMRRHREGSYHSKKKHYCSSCDKSYTRKYKLDEHERKHHLSNN